MRGRPRKVTYPDSERISGLLVREEPANRSLHILLGFGFRQAPNEYRAAYAFKHHLLTRIQRHIERIDSHPNSHARSATIIHNRNSQILIILWGDGVVPEQFES